MFFEGKIYNRRIDLHYKYGGNIQSGIVSCPRYSIILLFSSPKGEEYGYSDGWKSINTYEYTGEGQKGDMQFIRGNKAIRDHQADGKELHLFKKVNTGSYEYLGRFVYQSHVIENGADFEHHPRKVIRFILKKV